MRSTCCCAGLASAWRRPRAALVSLAKASITPARAFQVIKKGHDRQQASLYEKLGFGADTEAERVQRSPEELFQGLVQEALKLKDPQHDPVDKARLVEMKTAYRLLQDPVFRTNYGSHYYASNDARLHVLQDGGQVGANYNPEHQQFTFVDHASGRSVDAVHTAPQGSLAGTAADHAQSAGSVDAPASSSVGDFREAFRQATGASDPREARAHNAAEASGPVGGGDIAFTLRLTFQEALNGCTKRVRLLKHTKCRRCRGSGAQTLKKSRACPQCLGRGTVHLPSSTYHIERRCNYCGGDGRMPPPRCGSCGGRGVLLNQEVELPVTVPAHTRHLNVFQLQGLGHDGVRGGGPGALVLTVMVQPHRHLFQAADGSLHAMLPLPLSTALLGGLVPVPAARDENTRTVPLLHVPPCVRSGQVLRLWEHGVQPASASDGLTGSGASADASAHGRRAGQSAFPQDVAFHVLVMTPRGAELTGRQLEALGRYEAATRPEPDPATAGSTAKDEGTAHCESTVWARCATLKERYKHWLPRS